MIQDKIRVLFVCVHNSARSQMAEAFLNTLAGDRFEAFSAGFESAPINPLAIEVMKEAGIDISGKTSKDVFGLYKSGALFGYVIAVCDAESAQRCPTFPGITRTLAWSFPDPLTFRGTPEERLGQARRLRDEIRTKITEFIYDVDAGRLGGLDFGPGAGPQR